MSINRLLERFKENIRIAQFNAIRVGIASSEKIKTLSYGEVKKIETINYRTLKPERDGLFCPRIFGPVQDWTCVCGKYKRMKHRGIVCEKCGVEVIESRVRRERMGHIDLAAPVSHIWYLRGTPSYLSLILEMSVKDIDKVVYFEMYVVVKQGKSPYSIKTLLSPLEKQEYCDKHSDDTDFFVETGAEAIEILLMQVDLEHEILVTKKALQKEVNPILRSRVLKRMKVLSGLHNAKTRPEWMILRVLPVLPPDLRPLVPLDGGRFASADLNELYRRVINRNLRLKRLIEIKAPSVIIKNEKRMLQEAVDSLIDNGKRSQPVRMNKRPLKSLSEMLRGKQGRFRQNLLGKRVDYSGRSVIVVDPELNIDQCGIPKLMALELWKPHVLYALISKGIAPNIRIARKMVEQMEPSAWDVLEEIVYKYPVLLNRAPTLHRLGIQAFYPTLVDTKAIKIHPLVTGAFNADFDGDQMGVYIPLSINAIKECKKLILSSANLLSPQNGKPVMIPSQEIILGLHYITKIRHNVPGEGDFFTSVKEVLIAYEYEKVHLHAPIKVRFFDGSVVDTTVGRIVFYNALPDGSKIEWVNKIMGRGDLAKLIEEIYFTFGSDKTVRALDKIKKLGFHYATVSGVTFSYEHLITPKNRKKIITQSEKEVDAVKKLYLDGKITSKEWYSRVLQIWDTATSSVASDMMEDLKRQDQEATANVDGACRDFNFLYMALDSKSRGSTDQIKQLIGMRGLMAKPSGEIMETPIISNFRDGLSVSEYFIATHGARKGQADTALKTASAGYLTRRLVDVAQDVIVTKLDCGVDDGLSFSDLLDNGEVIVSLAQRVFGKVVLRDVKDPISRQVLIFADTLITSVEVQKIENSAVSEIVVRSVVKCNVQGGVCARCYGMDLSKNALVSVGCPVGIIAAQSIGEPGTQLTMRTFHIGGTASLADKTLIISKVAGFVKLIDVEVVTNALGKNIVVGRRGRLVVTTKEGKEVQKNSIEYGSILYITSGEYVEIGVKLFEWDGNNSLIITEKSGKVRYVDLIKNITFQNRYDETTDRVTTVIVDQKNDKYQPMLLIEDETGNDLATYYLPVGAILVLNDGDDVAAGDIIAKIPREISKNKDITGGLPKIADLFEARLTKDPCVLSDIDGYVSFGAVVKGVRKISVVGADKRMDYLVHKGRQLAVNEGDFVNAGDSVTKGNPALLDLLRIKGITYVQYHLVNQIQCVYRAQGVPINDRHFELIVKQMTRKVRIVDPGDTNFLQGEKVDRVQLSHINEVLKNGEKKVAVATPEVMGITMASLETESFISAASFQETTRILSEAAVLGKVDCLYGPKENVIIGHLIPAGTGLREFMQEGLREGNFAEE